MPFNMGATELLIIAGIVILLFGATKLPQMARSLGQSARVFKAETRGMKADEEEAKKDKDTTSQNEPQQLPASESSAAPKVGSSVEEPQHNDAKN